jgi:hypothetical protein
MLIGHTGAFVSFFVLLPFQIISFWRQERKQQAAARQSQS